MVDDVLVGECKTCKRKVATLRRAAKPPSKKIQTGVWNDTYTAECPKCKAMVQLHEPHGTKNT